MNNTARQPTRDEYCIPAHVKSAVLGVAPDAEVILYGSRARGDFGPESDWDFLVLCEGGENRVLIERIREAVHAVVYEIGSEYGCWPCITTKVHSREYWGRSLIQASPYHREVTRDGIPV